MQDPAEPFPEMFVLDDGADHASLAEAEDRGRADGERLAYRHAVRQALEIRFGALPESLSARLESEPDVGRLVAWHVQAVTLQRLEDLES